MLRRLASFGAQAPDQGAQQLQLMGLVALRHMGSQFPDQGSNWRPLNCKAVSQPLDHQEVPGLLEYFKYPILIYLEILSLLIFLCLKKFFFIKHVFSTAIFQ